MSQFTTKSKNLHIYKHFFKYDNPSDIPFEELGKKLGKKPNALRALLRSAKNDYRIYIAYRRMGYQDSDIPLWFQRPPKKIADFLELDNPPTQRSSATQRPKTAENASTLSAPTSQRPESTPNCVIVSRETDERSASLSTAEHSQRLNATGPGYINLNDGKRYPLPADYQTHQEPPIDPRLKKELEIYIEQQEEQFRISQERIYGRKKPEPPSLDTVFAQVEAAGMAKQAKFREMATFMMVINASAKPKKLDLKSLAEKLNEIFKKIGEERKQKQKQEIDAIATVCNFYRPRSHSPDIVGILREDNEVSEKKRKRDEDALLNFIIKIRDRKRKKHPLLEEMENTFQDLCANFFKNIQ